MKVVGKSGWQFVGAAVPNNLPSYLTSFVGRGTDLARLKSLLSTARMVTLTGPGGAGKSRLAAELGWACLDRWPGAIWWVELAPVSDSRQVAGVVASTLDLQGQGAPLDVVIAWLAARRALLVLDNCEHLVAACADFCQTALERCAELTIVATSREALSIPGEVHWPVSSLPTPEAMHLFEARARLVLPTFNVVAQNQEQVSEICERLDGMPLAVELAAARLGMMTEPEILRQLAHRFRLLTGGHRTAPDRQQTLKATIDWSYRLLTGDEALLFRRLSVFRGGFTLESAQAVCADGSLGSVLDLLSALVQKSMVAAERTDRSGSRYRLLESQLVYAEDRLREAGELELMQRRHYEYFLDGLSARSRKSWLARPTPGFAEQQWITRETGNLWAAMGWARNKAEDLGLTLAADLSLIRHTDIPRARSLLADLLDSSPAKGAARAYALRAAATLANLQCDFEGALRAAETALALARELGDFEVLAMALNVAGHAHSQLGELDAGMELYDEACAVLKGSSYRPLMTKIRSNKAWQAIVMGDFATARDILSECVAVARAENDDWGTASSLDGLAWAQWGLNNQGEADANFKEAMAVSRRLLDDWAILDSLGGLLCVAGACGNDQRVVRLAAALNRLSDECPVRPLPWVEMRSEESQRRSRSRLGARKSQEAWTQGWTMTIDQVLDYALHESEPDAGMEAAPLSRREQEVARLVAAGMTNRQIGNRLFISERTAEGHLERIRNKLKVRSRAEVAAWAVERGLVATQTPAERGLGEKRGTRTGPPSIQRR